jgi:hypothetical protein
VANATEQEKDGAPNAIERREIGMILTQGVTLIDRMILPDARPTLMALVGLKDDYHEGGRALLQSLEERALPASVRGDRRDATRVLGDVYKQLNAPCGEFNQQSLQISTVALVSGASGDDSRYSMLESHLADLGTTRDALAGKIRDALFAAEFEDRPINDDRTLRDLSNIRAAARSGRSISGGRSRAFSRSQGQQAANPILIGAGARHVVHFSYSMSGLVVMDLGAQPVRTRSPS